MQNKKKINLESIQIVLNSIINLNIDQKELLTYSNKCKYYYIVELNVYCICTK